MSESHIDELIITPALCEVVAVDTAEMHACVGKISSATHSIAGIIWRLQQVDQALANAHTVPGGAVSALPARHVLGTGFFRLGSIRAALERLSAELTTAAQRYHSAETSVWEQLRSATGSSRLWQETFGAGIPTVSQLLLAPPNAFLKALSDRHLTSSIDRPLAEYYSPKQRIAALFAGGPISFRQLTLFSPTSWLPLFPDFCRSAFGLSKALFPIADPGAPGINRAEGAGLARSLARVLHPGSDAVGGAAADGARTIEAVQAGLGYRTIELEKLPAEQVPGQRPVRSFSGSLAVMDELAIASGASPGEIRIDKVTSEAGTRSWQVFIPGGQGFDPAHAHSLLHTLSAVDGGATPSTAMILTALREVGAKKGEPIVMVGHSHGGITASALANNARVRAEFDIPMVLTAGSPLDRHELRPDTEIVALEHVEDFVPGLDGVELQARGGITTVSRALAASPNPEIAAGTGPAHGHDYPNYIDTAALADSHPQLAGARQRLESLIPDGRVETFRFRAEITR